MHAHSRNEPAASSHASPGADSCARDPRNALIPDNTSHTIPWASPVAACTLNHRSIEVVREVSDYEKAWCFCHGARICILVHVELVVCDPAGDTTRLHWSSCPFIATLQSRPLRIRVGPQAAFLRQSPPLSAHLSAEGSLGAGRGYLPLGAYA